MATQNPIEQQGTYPLPEAQLDRFLMYVTIGYPSDDSEKAILKIAREQARGEVAHDIAKPPVISQHALFAARRAVLDIYMSESVENYLLQLVLATRSPERWSETLGHWIRYGASPRGSIALDRCAKAHAWLEGRDYVSVEDVQAVAVDVLRHRVLLSYEAEAQGIRPEEVIHEIIQWVPVP
jgi:MoxR-like ATPase